MSREEIIQTLDQLRSALAQLLARVEMPADAILVALSEASFELQADQEPAEYTEPAFPVEVYAALPVGVDIRKVDLLTINVRHDLGVDSYDLERDEQGLLRSTTGVHAIPDEVILPDGDGATDSSQRSAR